jgi:thiosulfate/3-mercaptopyruvate sulfurtransferase
MKRFLNANEFPSDVIILDARTEAQFSSSHLPTARHAEFVVPKFVIRDQAGLEYFHHTLQTWVRSVGLNNGDRLVVYDSGVDSRAARTAWALEYAGFAVGILNGGFRAWEAAGQPISSEAPHIEISNFKLEPHLEFLATADEVLNRTEDTIVLDARDAQEFEGVKIPAGAIRGGHIPGSQHFEWTRVMTSQGFQLDAELERSLAEIPKGAQVIVHCQSGARSAVLFHVLKSQGFEVKNYLGSMNEWLNQPDLPVE